MEKHTCKLCFRSFANGRALGGHMRSHVATSAKVAAQFIKDSSSSSPSESSSSRDEDDDKMMTTGPLVYGLRENPKKSFRLVDQEFSSTFPAVDASSAAVAASATPAAGSSIVVQDRESETESSRAPTTTQRRRSKRARKAVGAAVVVSQPDPLPLAEPEPVSSVSDTTPEEDVAISLMMLSRDFWAPMTKSEEQLQQSEPERQFIIEDEEDEDEIEVEACRARNRNHQHPVKGRSKYQCGTCKKMFRSYQALGGHRASHKKTNGCVPPASPVARAQLQIHHESSEANAERVQHECPVCFRVFSSGQALGGHKRSHLTNSSAATITITSSTSIAPPPAPAPAAPIAAAVAATKYESFIDLNLPAPMEDDAELSAVSDAEFVVPPSSKYA